MIIVSSSSPLPVLVRFNSGCNEKKFSARSIPVTLPRKPEKRKDVLLISFCKTDLIGFRVIIPGIVILFFRFRLFLSDKVIVAFDV